LLLVNATLAPPAGAAAFNVTAAGEDAPAAIEVEVTVTLLTEVAVLELPVPVELPLPPLPDPPVEVDVPLLDGAPENAPLEVLPLFDPMLQPIKFVTAKSIATAMPSERVRKLSLNPLAHIATSERPKAISRRAGIS